MGRVENGLEGDLPNTRERVGGMVDLLVFDSIPCFLFPYVLLHSQGNHHLLFYEAETILLPLHIILSLLVLNFKFTCVETR